MAKKLNKKVAIIGITLLILVFAGGSGLFIYRFIQRNPNRALKLHRQALEAGDYLEAETQLGLAYAYGKSDEYKIQRLFELADFHLIHNDQHEAEWRKAMGCWSKIVSIDSRNIEARRALLDYYYQAADSGNPSAWREVQENTTEIFDTLATRGVEPELFVQKAHAKALLSIASRGDTTDRRTPLEECMNLLTELLENEPQDEELYQLMAEAESVKGQLNQMAGVIDALENSKQKAIDLLEVGIEQSDDKAMAVANLIFYKLQTAGSDPNAVEILRAEIDQRCKEVQPNDKLWLATSIVYETAGKLTAESEINHAIEAIRKAHELDPENFEYALRKARLMYRKGNAFNDPAAIEDALMIAEDALSLEQVQDVPGPLQGRNFRYRLTLNNFLTDLYLEKALTARELGDAEQAEVYVQKAQERIEEIISAIGTTENPIILKFQGLVALAQGEESKAIRMLYDSYQQNKALDIEGEMSNVDSRVCLTLAKIAARKNMLGLQFELLQSAYTSRDRHIVQQPQIMLDYMEVTNELRHFRGWANVIQQLGENYQARYGVTDQSSKLLIEAYIALGQFDKATEQLSSLDHLPGVKIGYELEIQVKQIAQLKKAIIALEKEGKTPDPEQTEQLETLYRERNAIVEEILRNTPKEMDPQRLGQICSNLIRNDRASVAVGFLDTYLAATPNILNLMVLRLQAQQPEPLELTIEQMDQLREQAIDSISDAKLKALAWAIRYRSQNEYESALKALDQYLKIDPEDPEVLMTRFDIFIDQEDAESAEELLQIVRRENLDQCGGNLSAARIEMMKENYPLALRRLDESLTLQPFSSSAYYFKSQVQKQLDNEEAAIESAQKAIRMDPKNPIYAQNLASLIFARNTALGSKVTVEQQNEAERAITLAMALSPGNLQLQSVYAETIQLQAPDRALSIRQRILEANPTAINAMMLGNMALRMSETEWDPAKRTGLIELAGKAYQQGMEIEPDNEPLRQTYADYLSMTQQGDKAIEMLGDDENLLWKHYLRTGQYEQAEAILNDLLDKNNDDPLLVRGLILVSEGAGKRDQVKTYLTMFSQIDETKDAELWIMQKYIENGFTAEVENKLASFRERHPDEKSANLIEAWIEMGKGNLDEALTLVNRYLETDADNPSGWRLRGRLYRLMNQPRKAVEDLQRAKGLQDTPAVRVELATVYEEMNQITAAIGELVPALDDPQTPLRIRLMLEGIYQKNNRTGDLEKFYQATLEKYPESVFWYSRFAQFYLMQNKMSQAREVYERVWQICKDQGHIDVAVLGGLLDTLYFEKAYDQVFSVATDQIDGPAAPLAYTYIAQVQVQRGQNEEAVGNFHKALDKAGANTKFLETITRKILKMLGRDYVDSWISQKLDEDDKSLSAHLLSSRMAQWGNLHNKAIEHMDKCIESVEEDSPSWIEYNLEKINLLLMAYTKTADSDYMNRALELHDQMLQKMPSNASLLNNMAYLMASNDRDIEIALEYARKAHLQDPGNATYLDTYAFVQCKNGDFEEAEQNLIRAIQIYEVSGQPIPWDLYEHFGMAKEGQGENADAIEMYQKALDASDQLPETEQQRLRSYIQQLQQL